MFRACLEKVVILATIDFFQRIESSCKVVSISVSFREPDVVSGPGLEDFRELRGREPTPAELRMPFAPLGSGGAPAPAAGQAILLFLLANVWEPEAVRMFGERFIVFPERWCAKGLARAWADVLVHCSALVVAGTS